MALLDISWTTIIIVILLVVVGYFIWSMVTSSSSTSSTGTTKLTTVTTLNITPSNSNSFTFSTWIAINKWGSGGGNLVSMGDAATTFALKLGTSTNKLHLSIGAAYVEATAIAVGLVPLQTWVSVIVSVNNGNSADIYINGKLVKTIALTATYTLPAGSATVGGPITAIDGYISTTYDNKSIGPQEAWNIYSSGYGGGGGSGVGDFFNKYKIRFAFVKDNVELSRLDI
jgi:hypothetical protein